VSHPETSTVTACRRYRGRWIVYLDCKHKLYVSTAMPRPKIGASIDCPEKPIGVVLVDDFTGEETPYDPLQRTKP
jgi:hypothetical protein